MPYTNKAHNFKDKTGLRKGFLTVLRLDIERSIKKRTVWICRCDCGNLKSIDNSNLRPSGKTVSCGCYQRKRIKEPRKPQASRMSAYDRAIRVVWDAYRKRARLSELVFGLSFDQFVWYLRQPCWYCGTLGGNCLNTQKRHRTQILPIFATYNGLDRLNSDKGYLPENVVSCCGKCNWAKGTMGYIEFLTWISGIYKNRANVLESRNNPLLKDE